jgi:hypothetical protein
MTSALIVHLTGGLGNQLFQFAAALTCQKDAIEIDKSLGSPRGSNEGVPDLLSFTLPSNVTLTAQSTKIASLARKATGFALRSAIAPKNFEKNTHIARGIEFAVSVVLLIRAHSILGITRGSGVGYSQLRKTRRDQYLIGYFQSYRYPKENHSALQALEPIIIGPELKELIAVSKNETPLVVHFRFGDYLAESDFGIPGKNYYDFAINASWSTGLYKSIWVFSDDISLAKRKFPEELSKYVRWINNVDESPASTLHAMRFGRGYVIANSTFSWWGAYLSMTKSAPVFAPMPWFKGMESPNELLPPNWKTADSDF